MNIIKTALFLAALLWGNVSKLWAQEQTYCNPLNIDYTYMIYNSHRDISYRSGADPAAVEFRGEYYMFVTRSMGYWHSRDLVNWDFIKPENWYFQGSNAPTAFNYKDSVLYVTGNPSGRMVILATDNPKAGKWEPSTTIQNNLQDPELFIDDDGAAYMYWGSSNVHPIRVKKLNKDKRFVYEREIHELFNLDEAQHGWERFGENNYHPTLKEGYIEGPAMTKHNGKYYLQYAAPGTQFNVYADGYYVGESPMGPWEYAPNNPMCLKPGGFINGAGHGTTMKDRHDQYWHFASMALASNSHWERRLCLFPTYFDQDGLMYSNTAYGDYPRYGSEHPTKAGQHTGWMLLSYNKPAKVASSFLEVNKSTAHDGDYVVDTLASSQNAKGDWQTSVLTDENSKSYWVADANNDQEFVEIDLGKVASVYALQINFHDHESDLYSRQKDARHRYTVEASVDGKHWKVIVDKSNNWKDVPNDYVQLRLPEKARFVRYNNIEVPTPNFAMSEFRVFGLGEGKLPAKVRNFKVERQQDRRDAQLSWDKVKGAQGYNIRWGIAPDKLYHSWLVYDKNEIKIPSFDVPTTYYLSIEAFNENGISQPTAPVMMK
ncbi:family 43 glycosylhydrolase [Persicobacter diffluens]|uniref:Endo-1,4-beta-xylanase n=1 Tax=Persicobacter diffluens TaxID=981 RepID=A0AAN4W2K6_9BACT|nr:endo-1,4-beta-xylanase [Persicobacter diffluens]